MKKIILLVAVLVVSLTMAQESHSDIKWQRNFEKAKKQAQRQHKPLLMLFTGSDWCAPCKSLKKYFFNADKFKAYADKFVFMYVDFPRNKDLVSAEEAKQNKKLNKQFKVRSLPTIIVLNSNGKQIDKIKGFNMTGETQYHYEFVDKVLKK